MKPIVKGFFDPDTWTVSYVVYEKLGSPCLIIDSVLNYDHKSGRTKTKSADELIDFVKANQLSTEWILETHAHADHVSAAPYLKSKLGGKIAIGDHISAVQEVFKKVFNCHGLLRLTRIKIQSCFGSFFCAANFIKSAALLLSTSLASHTSATLTRNLSAEGGWAFATTQIKFNISVLQVVYCQLPVVFCLFLSSYKSYYRSLSIMKLSFM